MFSWESLRNPYGTTGLSNVPTALEHAGNFSQDVNNAGKPIVILESVQQSGERALSRQHHSGQPDQSDRGKDSCNTIRLPNRTALGNNFSATPNFQNTFDSFITRGDHRFSDKDSLSITYGKRFGRSNQPFEESNLGIFDPPIRDDRQLGGLSYTHMFRPTLLSETRFGLSRTAQRDSSGTGLSHCRPAWHERDRQRDIRDFPAGACH